MPPLTKMMEELAAGGGDLTQRLPIHSNDEIGQIAKAFNRFMETLAAMVREVKENERKAEPPQSRDAQLIGANCHRDGTNRGGHSGGRFGCGAAVVEHPSDRSVDGPAAAGD